MTDPELLSLLQPLDDHNRSLLDNVHPEDWVNPEPAERYHLVVIGGGTAGLVSAAGAAGLGARVALIERRLLGGDCLNYGCVPSKGMIRAARGWHDARQAARRFAGPATVGEGDFATVMERMRRLRAGISHHDSAQRFTDLGVDVFLGNGRFIAPDKIEVDGKQLSFRRAIIATGARPAIPPIPGCTKGSFLTNETIFTLTEVPQRLGVIGGGPIGSELAQTFARLGSHVTLFDVAPHLLINCEDADASAVMQESLTRDGVTFELESRISEIIQTAEGKVVHCERDGVKRQTTVDELLVATGRAPNVENLGLEVAGVRCDAAGVEVNDQLQTSNRQVYAVGDVASSYKYTHAADALARIAIQNALLFRRLKASDLVIPWCTYTSPEVAHVGLYRNEAKARGMSVETLTIPMREVDRALLDDDADGFLRIHIQQGKDRILGATLVAEHAGELIGQFCVAITAKVGLNTIAGTIFPYPTQAEVLKKAADTWRRGKLTPTVKKVFDSFFGIFR